MSVDSESMGTNSAQLPVIVVWTKPECIGENFTADLPSTGDSILMVRREALDAADEMDNASMIEEMGCLVKRGKNHVIVVLYNVSLFVLVTGCLLPYMHDHP